MLVNCILCIEFIFGVRLVIVCLYLVFFRVGLYFLFIRVYEMGGVGEKSGEFEMKLLEFIGK